MSEAGVLGRFIPEFGRIIALMQFNMYHHYTVDEHLLRAVGILSKIEQGLLKEDHPLATGLIERRRVAARAVCRRSAARHRQGPQGRPFHCRRPGGRHLVSALRADAAETETVVWLVRHHLVMSETAQMRDLSDYKTIIDFAADGAKPRTVALAA